MVRTGNEISVTDIMQKMVYTLFKILKMVKIFILLSFLICQQTTALTPEEGDREEAILTLGDLPNFGQLSSKIIA